MPDLTRVSVCFTEDKPFLEYLYVMGFCYLPRDNWVSHDRTQFIQVFDIRTSNLDALRSYCETHLIPFSILEA